MSLVSVIVPVYNVEKYINRCIDSILNQTYRDFELILIDDGSTDLSGEICDYYFRIDKRVHVLHKKNGGLSSARNVGIDWALQNSNCEWITFIDSDDWVDVLYLQYLIEIGIEKKVDIVVAGYEKTTDNKTIVEQGKKAIYLDTEKYYVENIINATVAWGKLFRKTLFEEIRFPEGKIHEDEYVIYRLLFKYRRLWIIPEPLYAYYQNPNGIMKSQWNIKRLDSIDAIYKQVCFFENKKMFIAAKARYLCLIGQIVYYFRCVSTLKNIDTVEKRKILFKLEKMIKNLLLRYKKYRWFSYKNGIIYLQAYGLVYKPLYWFCSWLSNGKKVIIYLYNELRSVL